MREYGHPTTMTEAAQDLRVALRSLAWEVRMAIARDLVRLSRRLLAIAERVAHRILDLSERIVP